MKNNFRNKKIEEWHCFICLQNLCMIWLLGMIAKSSYMLPIQSVVISHVMSFLENSTEHSWRTQGKLQSGVIKGMVLTMWKRSGGSPRGP